MEKSENTKSMERAVDSAVRYFAEMMKASGTKISSARLEEITKSEDNKNWEVTLSYIDVSSAGPFSEIYGVKDSDRIYKIVAIDVTSFDAVSMKNR